MAAKKTEEAEVLETVVEETVEVEVDPNAYYEELVDVRLFKDNGKYKDPVFVSVNGESILIERGVKVQIKRKFAEVLEQSQEQDEFVANLVREASMDYERNRSQLV